MQKLCKDKFEWDQALQGKLLNERNKLVRDLEVSAQIAVLRCYFGVDKIRGQAAVCTGFVMP